MCVPLPSAPFLAQPCSVPAFRGAELQGKTCIWLLMKGFCKMSVSLCFSKSVTSEADGTGCASRRCHLLYLHQTLPECVWNRKLVFVPFRPFHSGAYSKFWHYPERLYEIYYSTHQVSLALPCKPIWSGCLSSPSCCDSWCPGNLRTSFCWKWETFFYFSFLTYFFSCRPK